MLTPERGPRRSPQPAGGGQSQAESRMMSLRVRTFQKGGVGNTSGWGGGPRGTFKAQDSSAWLGHRTWGWQEALPNWRLEDQRPAPGGRPTRGECSRREEDAGGWGAQAPGRVPTSNESGRVPRRASAHAAEPRVESLTGEPEGPGFAPL